MRAEILKFLDTAAPLTITKINNRFRNLQTKRGKFKLSGFLVDFLEKNPDAKINEIIEAAEKHFGLECIPYTEVNPGERQFDIEED